MKNQNIQEIANLKAAKLLFNSKFNILKDLLKRKKITPVEFMKRLKNLKYEYGPTIMSTMNDPTIATTMDRVLKFAR